MDRCEPVNIPAALEAVLAPPEGAPVRLLTVCDACGNPRIQYSAYVVENTDQLLPDEGPTDTYWCDDCDRRLGNGTTKYVEEIRVSPEAWDRIVRPKPAVRFRGHGTDGGECRFCGTGVGGGCECGMCDDPSCGCRVVPVGGAS